MKVKTKSKKVNKAWLNDHVNDTYVKLALKEGYRARAAYKLKEIDETFGLIRPGDLVVDLGSAPGAWSQYLRRRLSPEGAAVGELNGSIIALDILPIEPVEGVQFIQGDFRENEVATLLEAALQGRQADVVVSDMAPNLSGIESSDSARVQHLIELAVEFAQNHMKPQGGFGGQGLPWQRLQPDRQDVQGDLQGGQADQAQIFPGQVFGDFFGGYGLDSRCLMS